MRCCKGHPRRFRRPDGAGSLRQVVVVGAMLLLAGALVSPAALAQQTQPSAGPLLPWHTQYSQALEEAQKRRLPIIVDVGADWCEWCRRLDEETAKPPAQQALGSWIRVRIDADRDEETVRKLAVGPIPALRILTPAGRVVAARNGFLNVQDLVAWLNDHRGQATAVPAQQLMVVGAVTAADVDGLIKELTDPDAVSREAAVRRLRRAPGLAAPRLVTLFESGNLRQRLAVLELLRFWQAPIEYLDPWDPRTITKQRIAALQAWAATADHVSTTQPAILTLEQLAVARRDVSALLQASSEAELEAPRERLAQLGQALLPEVRNELSVAATDRDRERLTALRYRLCSSDALALNWPDGFERLASSDPQVRRASLDELGSRLTSDDEPLLIELFASPDPFVRERSLQLMQAGGSDAARAGLLKLLNDPESNVRAAVLKQLAEAPQADLVPAVVKYAAGESDPDLIVHAVRFFREVKTGPAIECLMSLLANPSWRVRAEAAAALGKCLETNRGSQYQTAVCDAMIKLLDDPDGFVASQAIIVLNGTPVGSHVNALVKATEKRPQLANDVVKVLASDTQSPAAQAQLHKFTSVADADVRGAALQALAQNADPEELAAALKSDRPRLRESAANVLMEVVASQRPDQGRRFGSQGKAVDWAQWLDRFRKGDAHPQWAPTVVAPLRQMLTSGSASERVAAAVPLAALTDDPQPLGVLSDAARSDRTLARQAAAALPWLAFEKRVELFKALAATLKSDSGAVGYLAEQLAALPDERTAGLLWDLLAGPASNLTLTGAVDQALERIFFAGGAVFENGQMVLPESAKHVIPSAKQYAASGSASQRLVALALLLHASPDDAAEAARKVLAEVRPTGDGLHTAAFQVLLLGLPKDDAVKASVAQLAKDDSVLRKLALIYLAIGADGIRAVQQQIYLSSSISDFSQVIASGNGRVIVVPVPPGLKSEQLLSLLKDPDSEVQAYAGYLLCLLDRREGLDSLIIQWRRQISDREWRKLVYRAVAMIGDDSLVPLLDEVYHTYRDNDWEIRDFYWTIRAMEGPNILKLRKKIRDEVGMERLQ